MPFTRRACAVSPNSSCFAVMRSASSRLRTGASRPPATACRRCRSCRDRALAGATGCLPTHSPPRRRFIFEQRAPVGERLLGVGARPLGVELQELRRIGRREDGFRVASASACASVAASSCASCIRIAPSVSVSSTRSPASSCAFQACMNMSSGLASMLRLGFHGVLLCRFSIRVRCDRELTCVNAAERSSRARARSARGRPARCRFQGPARAGRSARRASAAIAATTSRWRGACSAQRSASTYGSS